MLNGGADTSGQSGLEVHVSAALAAVAVPTAAVVRDSVAPR